MMLIRFLGIGLAFFVTFVIAKLTGIPVLDMMVIVNFLLVFDSLMVRFIHRQYLMAVMEEIDKEEKDDGKKE